VTWLIVGALALAALVLLAYGLFEAGWLRTRVLEVEIEGLPQELDGLRIAHLSDFHLGVPSRGRGATERAVAWVAGRRPELVCVTGDLVSHPRGVPRLVRLLGTLERPLVVLGNHDVAVTRDPFSRAAELDGLGEVGVLLRDEAVTVERAGRRIQIVGVDAESYPRETERPWELTDGAADLRILLCHFPGIVHRLPDNAFHLVLAGHLHAGQIVLPYPGGRVTLAHLGARFVAGIYPTSRGVLHVSPGTGTTFVPLRFFARPEVTELVLRPAGAGLQQSR
jgi:predicted MPP superfamily phosphohydrolase